MREYFLGLISTKAARIEETWLDFCIGNDRGETGDYNDLATLTLVGGEGAIKNLLARDQRAPFSVASLSLFIVAYFLTRGRGVEAALDARRGDA